MSEQKPSALCVVTNNPQIATMEGISIDRVAGCSLAVLDRVETCLQSGYRLISAPLPPNIPLMRAFYRSILMESAPRQYDAMGLLSVAAARERILAQRAVKDLTDSTDDDFASIDKELLERALRDHAWKWKSAYFLKK